MNGKNLQELINNLAIFYKCPSCGAQYPHENISFLGRVDEHCFMQLTCDGCSLPILATVLLSTELMKTIPTKPKLPIKASRLSQTDLQRGEKNRIAQKSEISSAEIAELALYLQNNSTNLKPKNNKI